MFVGLPVPKLLISHQNCLESSLRTFASCLTLSFFLSNLFLCCHISGFEFVLFLTILQSRLFQLIIPPLLAFPHFTDFLAPAGDSFKQKVLYIWSMFVSAASLSIQNDYRFKIVGLVR